jgi:hypothetical protein
MIGNIKFKTNVIYITLSIVIFLIWTCGAQTELAKRRESETGDGTSRRIDVDMGNMWGSVSGMVDGTVPLPFIKRRLLVDSALILANVIPDSFWLSLKNAIHGDSWLQCQLAKLLEESGWEREHYPLLFSAYFLIWLSTLGFLYGSRCFSLTQFEMTPATATAIGAILGIGLLGGFGSWNEYPYDIPNAFFFLLTLTAIVLKRWWLWLAFVAAAYSKETSVLLIFAFLLLNWDSSRSLRFWITVVGLGLIFLMIQLWMQYRFSSLPPGPVFWYPLRNLKILLKGAIGGCWYLSIVAVAVARMVRMRPMIPQDLRRLVLLVPVMVGLAFFKGWVEERRAYYEVYPLLGLIVIQWATLELGWERYLVPKNVLRGEAIGSEP